MGLHERGNALYLTFPLAGLTLYSSHLQVHFGAHWPHSFAALLRGKFGDHHLQRKIALEGHRFTPQEALQDGILDAIVDGKTPEIIATAEKIADRVSVNAATGVWGLIKVRTADVT